MKVREKILFLISPLILIVLLFISLCHFLTPLANESEDLVGGLLVVIFPSVVIFLIVRTGILHCRWNILFKICTFLYIWMTCWNTILLLGVLKNGYDVPQWRRSSELGEEWYIYYLVFSEILLVIICVVLIKAMKDRKREQKPASTTTTSTKWGER